MTRELLWSWSGLVLVLFFAVYGSFCLWVAWRAMNDAQGTTSDFGTKLFGTLVGGILLLLGGLWLTYD